MVLGHVEKDRDGRDTLFQCAQVNSLWADEATNLLWGSTSSWFEEYLPRLASIPGQHRMQLYANKVRVINSINHYREKSDVTEYYTRLSSLKFPRLVGASVSVTDETDEQRCVQYLQPTLRRLVLHENPNHYSRPNFKCSSWVSVLVEWFS